VDVQGSGRRFTAEDVELIGEIAASCAGLSRAELANTVCELLDWRRPGGGLKWRECLDLLSKLEARGLVKLPALRGPRRHVTRIEAAPVCAAVVDQAQLEQVSVVRVQNAAQRRLFRELIEGHHYLGYRMPFGARVQYLAYLDGERVGGCVQFSSAAWRLAARDRWIGWSDAQRSAGLTRVIQNSRFLILKNIQVPNLASRVLSLALRRVVADWQALYGVRPLLAETLVDSSHYRGTCYRAANWVEVGESAGRGRMDREHARHGAAPKRVFVYELVAGARQRLAG
jgi:hypothetical protein